MDFSELLEKAGQYLPAEKLKVVENAYHFALKAHEGQLRKSGEPFVKHPLNVAYTLAELQLDASSLAAALGWKLETAVPVATSAGSAASRPARRPTSC